MLAPSNSIPRAEVSAILAREAVEQGPYRYTLYYLRDGAGEVVEQDASCVLSKWDRQATQYPIWYRSSDPDVQVRNKLTRQIAPLLDPVLDSIGGGRAIVNYDRGELSLAVSK